ncbi:MAG: hypothetical protein ABWX73_15685 [Marmoricola sp.]
MTANTPGTGEGAKRVGLFDIRVIIGSLIGLYGIILVITGLFTSDSQIDKSDGLNINLVAGICMIVGAAVFIIWARVRPIVVPPDPAEASADEGTERPAQ